MKQTIYENHLENETVDIKTDYKTKEVYVVENGKEIFRMPKNEKNIALAHQIYMGVKYIEVEE